MAKFLVCWHCGASLKEIPVPIGRLAQCPRCRAELHTCRMCRHHGPELRYGCHHDRADPVLDKERANFCSFFRPRPNAYAPSDDAAQRDARARLDALFGANTAQPIDEATSGAPASGNGEDPRARLDNLFKLDPD